MVLSTPVFADWTQVGVNVDGNTFYVDFDTIKQHQGYVFWWMLFDLLKPSSDGTISGTGGGKIGITEGRFSTIRTQLNRHLVPFLGEKTKLQDIDGNQFRNSYTQWRKKRSPNVTDVTIINERATIGSVFRFAFDKQWIRQNQLPRWEEMKKNARSRDALELDEWREVYTYLRTWTKNDTEDHIIFQKDMVREFILILANTGLRFGELRYLRWGNVRLFTEKDENGRDEVKSRIDVEV